MWQTIKTCVESTSTTQVLLAAIVLVISLVYIYFRHCFSYWKRRDVPSLNPVFPFGDIAPSVLAKESIFLHLKNLYDELKQQGHDFGGIYFFNGPVFMPVDQKLIKDILQVNFDHFVDRGVYYDKENVPISYHLFAMEGQEWKTLRAKLTPTFTSGKMRNMFEIMKTTTQQLVRKFNSIDHVKEEADLKEILQRYTIDTICSCAFGVEANSLSKEESEFVNVSKRMFDISVLDLARCFLSEGFTSLGSVLKTIYKDPRNHGFLESVARETIKYRKNNNVKRNDLLNIMIELMEDGKLTFDETVAQTFLFFAAGFETTSLTITYCLHELAHNQNVQDKLRDEVYAMLGSDVESYTYERVLSLPYLDNVINGKYNTQ